MKTLLISAALSCAVSTGVASEYISPTPAQLDVYARVTNHNAMIFAAARTAAPGSPVLPPAPPPNDNFASSTPVAGDTLLIGGNNTDATREPSEPFHLYTLFVNTFGENSIWWRWTPASSGLFGIDTRGSAVSTIIAVYSGSSLTALNRIQSSPGYVYLQATAGQTYYIAVMGLTSADEGPITLNIYPDTHSPLFNNLSVTNNIFSGIPAADGSILTVASELILRTYIKTNRFGIAHELRIVNDFYPEGITITDRKHRKIADNVNPGYVGPNYRVMGYTGKYCYLYDQNSRTLYAFRVSKKGLKFKGSQFIDNLAQIRTFGSQVFALRATVNLIRYADSQSAVIAMDKKLKNSTWQLPFENGFIHSALLKKEIFVREYWNTYTIDLTFSSADDVWFTRSAQYDSGGTLYFSIDRKGGLFYWRRYMAIVAGFGIPVTYIDKDGVTVINYAFLDARTDVTSYVPYTADYIYGLIEGPGDIRIVAYKIGKKIKAFNEQTVPHYINGQLVKSTFFALQQDLSGAQPLYGFTAFDKKLKKARWTAPLAEGAVTIIDHKTASRALVAPSGGSTVYTYRIFNSKKIIAEHQFVR